VSELTPANRPVVKELLDGSNQKTRRACGFGSATASQRRAENSMKSTGNIGRSGRNPRPQLLSSALAGEQAVDQELQHAGGLVDAGRGQHDSGHAG
jgi:hypothetical protein